MQWFRKFAVAITGITNSVRNHHSFRVHALVSLAVFGVATWLPIAMWRWVALVLAVTLVWTAELLNTSLEELVRAIHPEQDQRVGRALDAAAGGVLVASIGAAAIGLLTLGPPLWARISIIIVG